MSATSTSSGGSPRNGASRSSGGTNGRPSAAYTPASVGASGSGPSASTYASEPVARSSSVPKRAGGATTRSTGTPSTVNPRARSITATICGSASNRASTAAGSADAQTTASRSQESRQRRGSPAIEPSSAAAMSPTSARA